MCPSRCQQKKNFCKVTSQEDSESWSSNTPPVPLVSPGPAPVEGRKKEVDNEVGKLTGITIFGKPHLIMREKRWRKKISKVETVKQTKKDIKKKDCLRFVKSFTVAAPRRDCLHQSNRWLWHSTPYRARKVFFGLQIWGTMGSTQGTRAYVRGQVSSQFSSRHWRTILVRRNIIKR